MKSREWYFACMLGLAMAFVPWSYAINFEYLPEMDIVELSPQMRPIPLSAALYTKNTEDITMFLDNVLIFDDMDHYETLPYIVGFDRSADIGGTGDTAYTKGLNIKNDLSEYSLLQPGSVLTHPETDEKLGMQAFVVGRAMVQKFGATQTVLITDCTTNLQINTRLTPLVGIDLPGQYEVKYPPKKVDGFILAIQTDRKLAGSYNSVVVSLGERDGVKAGNILDIIEGDRTVQDKNDLSTIHLPTTKIGELLIYDVKKKISLALITYSKRVIIIGDVVTSPAQQD